MWFIPFKKWAVNNFRNCILNPFESVNMNFLDHRGARTSVTYPGVCWPSLFSGHMRRPTLVPKAPQSCLEWTHSVKLVFTTYFIKTLLNQDVAFLSKENIISSYLPCSVWQLLLVRKGRGTIQHGCFYCQNKLCGALHNSTCTEQVLLFFIFYCFLLQNKMCWSIINIFSMVIVTNFPLFI